MEFGYARVSTGEQTTDPQLDRLKAAGVQKIYKDHGVSGVKASRPQWDKLLENLRGGDVLVVTKLDRIGRSLKNLIEVAEMLRDRGVALRVLDQGIDTSTPAGRMFYHMVGAMAEFEHDLIVERTNDGLRTTRRRKETKAGKPYLHDGRPPALKPAQVASLVRMYRATDEDGYPIHTVPSLAAKFGISRTTVYAYLKRHGATDE
jgi:DNA invertase Pin-like site-specific DNA recombinase